MRRYLGVACVCAALTGLLLASGASRVAAQSGCFARCCEFGIHCSLACCYPGPNQAPCMQEPCSNYCTSACQP